VRQRVTRIFCGRKAGADRRILAGSRKGGSISIVYFIFRPDIVVADYAPTANPFFNSVIEQLVGLARRHAVPVIYMRRQLHRKWLDGDTPTTRSRPTRPASSAPRTCASLPWPRRCRLSRQLLDGFRSGLEPASPAVPAATEKNQQDDDDDHKCRGIHAAF
jgi:hypothetical protein